MGYEESVDYRVDLHCHSTCSDGSLTPIQLLHHAKSCGLSGISITDHDTLSAYTPEVYECSQSIGIKLFVGVECSSYHDGVSVHLLGYGLKLSSEIEAFFIKHQNRRRLRNKEIFKRLYQQLQVKIDEKDFEAVGSHSIGRLHIAKHLVNIGVATSTHQVFNQWLGDGKSCFYKGELISAQETIEVIHRANGKVFVAHPHLIKKHRVIKGLVDLGVDGLECYYGRCYHRHPYWLKVADMYGLLKSGGSDFHGLETSSVTLGCSWTSQDDLVRIFGNSHE